MKSLQKDLLADFVLGELTNSVAAWRMRNHRTLSGLSPWAPSSFFSRSGAVTAELRLQYLSL